MTDQNPPEFDLFPRGPAPAPADPSRLVVALLAAAIAAFVTFTLTRPADPIECALMQAAGVLE